MNYPTTLSKNKQGAWSDNQIQLKDWPLQKSKEQLKEEIWQSIELEIKDFTKSLIESILEQTIKQYLQLEKYQRSKQRIDYRNGYYQRKLQTKYGTINELSVPRLRNNQPEFQVFGRYETRQPQIDKLIGQMYLAGISTKKLRGIVQELTGKTLSHSTIAKIDQEIFEKTLAKFQNQPIPDDINICLLMVLDNQLRTSWAIKRRLAWSPTVSSKQANGD